MKRETIKENWESRFEKEFATELEDGRTAYAWNPHSMREFIRAELDNQRKEILKSDIDIIRDLETG